MAASSGRAIGIVKDSNPFKLYRLNLVGINVAYLMVRFMIFREVSLLTFYFVLRVCTLLIHVIVFTCFFIVLLILACFMCKKCLHFAAGR